MRYHQIRCSSRTCKGGCWQSGLREPDQAFVIIALRPDEAVDHQTQLGQGGLRVVQFRSARRRKARASMSELRCARRYPSRPPEDPADPGGSCIRLCRRGRTTAGEPTKPYLSRMGLAVVVVDLKPSSNMKVTAPGPGGNCIDWIRVEISRSRCSSDSWKDSRAFDRHVDPVAGRTVGIADAGMRVQTDPPPVKGSALGKVVHHKRAIGRIAVVFCKI